MVYEGWSAPYSTRNQTTSLDQHAIGEKRDENIEKQRKGKRWTAKEAKESHLTNNKKEKKVKKRREDQDKQKQRERKRQPKNFTKSRKKERKVKGED